MPQPPICRGDAATLSGFLFQPHRQIGLIIGPDDKVGRVQKRFLGYKAAMADHGFGFDPSLLISTTEPDLAEGKTTIKKLLIQKTRLSVGAKFTVKGGGRL